MTISGVTSGKSMRKFELPDPRPCQRAKTDRQEHADRRRDDDVGDRELEALDERAAERRVVPDGVDRVAPVPAGREALPGPSASASR